MLLLPYKSLPRTYSRYFAIQKRYCKNCNGNALCIHNKYKYSCIDCKGNGLCIHNKNKKYCIDCNGSEICIHNKNKRYCKDCKGSGICIHKKSKYLCKDCKLRYRNNPLRMLDCKKKKCNEYTAEAPQIVDHLDEESKDHLMKMLEYLDDFDLPYVLNPQIVRGLDYYTKTVFEIWMKDDTGARTGALGGGGRYDNLIELLGGRETPSLGFAIGIERIVSRLKEANIRPPASEGADIFLAQLGEEARKKAFSIMEELRAKGYKVMFNLCKGSLKQQLELANKAEVRLTLILGEKEVAEKSILIKEMDLGAQESVPLVKLERELEKRLT